MRRVPISPVLKWLLCALSCTVGTAAIALWLWVENAAAPPEREARMRGCALCHGDEWQRRLHPDLRRREPGSAISPTLQSALQRSHPTISRGAKEELVTWLVKQQQPLLAAAGNQHAGRTLYLAKCAACHGRNGEGQAGHYPPLRGSEWLTESPSRLPEILTKGLKGPITVRGEKWDSTMLAPGVSTQSEIENIIQYIKNNFTQE
ncbi:MAG: cytochrome c [Akkermansia sp.]|nr:cytochrome c [Akkermansia sp.]